MTHQPRNALENLPPRTRLGLGSAVIDVTPEPHWGVASISEH